MEFDRFLKETLPDLGYDWRRHRRRAVRRKLLARLGGLGIAGFDEYRQLLLQDPGELRIFKGLLTVTISRFYRDPALFGTLRDRVIPKLLASRGSLDIWSAGAASGEEPYTLAMIAGSYFPDSDISITATDIDRACLQRARDGVYPESSLRKLPDELRARYFTKAKGGWRIDGGIMERVRFLVHDIITDDPPGLMDAVLCRNLAFTYFGPEQRERAAEMLFEAIRPGGVLVLGRTESLPPEAWRLFTMQYPEDKIYLRNEDRLH